MDIIDNMSRSHDRVLEERETSEKETKRLREVCMMFAIYARSSYRLISYSTKLFELSGTGFGTPRTENSFCAMESPGD